MDRMVVAPEAGAAGPQASAGRNHQGGFARRPAGVRNALTMIENRFGPFAKGLCGLLNKIAQKNAHFHAPNRLAHHTRAGTSADLPA
jgi:hypothetical protein